jgi:ribonuclease BN (tRNA processing enzyme)
MKIEILGAHNAEFQDHHFVSMLIDDQIAIDAGCLTSTLNSDRQHRLKAILLSHFHYDHVRDIPSIAMNNYTSDSKIKVYATEYTRHVIVEHLLNGVIYPKFYSIPSLDPVIEFFILSPEVNYNICGYQITALPVKHVTGAVAYKISDRQGSTLFYTGDTGPDFSRHLKNELPSILISEVTFPNKAEEHAHLTNHLTPKMLQAELERIFEMHGRIPPVMAIHTELQSQVKIRMELQEVSRELKTKIGVAEEGLILHL